MVLYKINICQNQFLMITTNGFFKYGTDMPALGYIAGIRSTVNLLGSLFNGKLALTAYFPTESI